MNNKIGYASLILVIGFMAWYFYSKGVSDAKFKTQMDTIEQARKNLEDTVNILKTNTANRDEKLRMTLQKNMSIIDTLNSSLAKVNASSKEIDNQIETNKQTINELWNNN